MKKKILALVLALVMTLSLLPVTAMAEDDNDASTTYTVTFDANGATGTVPTQAATAEGGKFKLPGVGDMEKYGYAFYGWKIGNTIYQAGQTYTMPAENVTFTAHWLRKPTVEINSFSVLDDIVTGIRTLEINYTLINRHTEEMTYDLWWRLATSTNGKIVEDKGPTHTLAGGEVYSGTLMAVIPANKADAVIQNAAQLRLHVRDEGSKSGSRNLTYFVLKTVQDNIHRGKYVTLDNNGGLYDGVDTNPKIFVDTAQKYGSVQWVDTSLYSKDGYTFLGYAHTANATTAEYADDTLKDVAWAGSEVETWYAVWAPNSYTITYDLGGGTVAQENPTTYTVESEEITLTNPTREGYTFAGWTGTGLDAATIAVTIASGSTGERAYTATWTANTPITYTVTFNANGHGTAPDAIESVTSGSTITAPTAPTADGYTFGGWYKESTCENEWNFSTDTVSADITLYAKWTEVPTPPPSSDTIVDTINLTVDWAKVPTLTVGEAGPEFKSSNSAGEHYLVVNCDGVSEYMYGWLRERTPEEYSPITNWISLNPVLDVIANNVPYALGVEFPLDSGYTFADNVTVTINGGLVATIDYKQNGDPINDEPPMMGITIALGTLEDIEDAKENATTPDDDTDTDTPDTPTPQPPVYYPTVDTTPVIPSVDVDIHNDSLSAAAKAVGSAVKSGTADITPVAGYTKDSIAQMQKDNALKLVVEKKNSYDPAEKTLIDKAAQEKGKAALVQFLEIDVTLRTMNDVIVAEVDDTVVPLTITVDLNAEMQKAAKEGKTIYVARAHDGKVTFIEGTLNAEKTQFTFDSSKFSTYALVAFDSQTVTSPKTADAGIFMAVSMSILSVTGSAVLLKKKED